MGEHNDDGRDKGGKAGTAIAIEVGVGFRRFLAMEASASNIIIIILINMSNCI